jgi:sugar phosphate isomerase/epimerase
MKISLGSWAFSFGPYASNPVAFETVAERLSAAGFDGIEVGGFPPHVTLSAYPSGESRRALLRYLRNLNLEVSGYAADFTIANPLTEGKEHKYLELFKQNLEMVVALESPTIRVDSIAAPGSLLDSEYDSAMDRLSAVWNAAAELAQDAAVRMVWEFEPGFLFNKPSEVLRVHEKVAHSNFNVLFDTSHAYMCGVVGSRQHGAPERLQGGVKEFLNMLSWRIGAIHVIDSDGSLHGDETSTHCPFGEGNIDFASLAPELKKIPDIDWWCIDLCFRQDAWNLVEPSLEYVRKMLK